MNLKGKVAVVTGGNRGIGLYRIDVRWDRDIPASAPYVAWSSLRSHASTTAVAG
jgi:hypothetical protein